MRDCSMGIELDASGALRMDELAGKPAGANRFNVRLWREKPHAGGRGSGGSDPGLGGFGPPQTYPRSFRRVGGRYRQSR